MKNRRNYYRILQVQPDAPAEIIRASYRTLMRELRQHPDLGGNTCDASLLNEAYEILSNPSQRAAYDREKRAYDFKRGVTASNNKSSRTADLLCPFCRTRLSPHIQAGGSCPVCKIPLPNSRDTVPDKTSRRTIARMKKDARIVYYASWNETPREGKMIDLSPKGMRFLCSEKLRPGTVLKITGPQITACGLVTNLHAADEQDIMPYSAGISFLTVQFGKTTGSFISLTG